MEADIFIEGYDLLSAILCYRGPRDTAWTEVAMAPHVELHPQVVPAHIFRLRRRIRTEQDFAYYL